MLAESLRKAIEEGVLDLELADKYLRLYVADIDWLPHIASLWSNISKKFISDLDKKTLVKNSISSTILHPHMLKTKVPDPPYNLLFWTNSWKNFSDHDWFSLLKNVFKEDLEISILRNNLLHLGVIDPIDVSPITRQAFNWLYQKSQDSGCVNDINKHEIIFKHKNLVRAYGGSVICAMFTRHNAAVDKVLNWRTGYFFEKEIHNTYSMDELVKIKQSEISKTNQVYIKKIGAE